MLPLSEADLEESVKRIIS